MPRKYKRKYQIYKDSKGEWRWRVVANNGRNVAVSGEGYSSKQKCSTILIKLFSEAVEVLPVEVEE